RPEPEAGASPTTGCSGAEVAGGCVGSSAGPAVSGAGVAGTTIGAGPVVCGAEVGRVTRRRVARRGGVLPASFVAWSPVGMSDVTKYAPAPGRRPTPTGRRVVAVGVAALL